MGQFVLFLSRTGQLGTTSIPKNNLIHVSYGGEHGFNQAFELSCEYLDNVKFIQEKRLLGKYFEEMSNDIDKYVFTVDNTIKALKMGVVEVLILWENLDMNHYMFKINIW